MILASLRAPDKMEEIDKTLSRINNESKEILLENDEGFGKIEEYIEKFEKLQRSIDSKKDIRKILREIYIFLGEKSNVELRRLVLKIFNLFFKGEIMEQRKKKKMELEKLEINLKKYLEGILNSFYISCRIENFQASSYLDLIKCYGHIIIFVGEFLNILEQKAELHIVR